MSHACSSIFCFIPPYVFQEIIENGSQDQRQQALRNIVSAEAIRIQREAASKSPPPTTEAVSPGLHRSVYSAVNTGNLPGQVVRSEGQPPSGDPAVDEAYDGAGATYMLYSEEYNRDSIDGHGLPIDSTVHFRTGYDNAFWNGRQMVYGDGDEDLPLEERLFNRFTISLDIIGHELTHGVIQYTANLVYQGQSGALNESWADVFGVLVKQRQLGQSPADADWIIGAGLFTPNVNGVGIRSMKAPGTAYDDATLGRDPQPGHMNDFVHTGADNGGVHINSGIPNRAFYITALELGGFAWEKAGQIWYATLRDRLGPADQFASAARKTFLTAGEMYGVGSLEQQAVRNGWAEVGLSVDDGTTGPPDGDGQPRPGCASTISGLFRSLFGKS